MKVLRSLLLLGVCTAGLATGARTQRATSPLKLSSSMLIEDIRRRQASEPRLNTTQLAAYANEQLARKGFDFQFDLCEFVKRNNSSPPSRATNSPEREHQYRLPLKQTNGQSLILEATVPNEQLQGGLCGECFFSVPATRVTEGEIGVIVRGRPYKVIRPRDFGLDEMSLVDSSLRRVIRTWQVPDQTEPLGVSSDGTKLYLGTGIDSLLLEISETAALRIVARDQLQLSKGELIEKAPADPKNSYLSFMRFRFGKKRLVIRYSAPCT